MLHVQFSDATQTEIVTYFGGPQDPAAHVNLGTVKTDDPRWLAFYAKVNGANSLGLPVPTK